ncbi:VOC family protein [Flavobacterium capsici]|uniref:VOC family protein n=1 Tax=Flavobacterium capsici TaxID=3075618 RepID=A0AA96EYE9_9FLAO|nr:MULTISPECIES: VOC family protein [unclassified Flavobacterium]WNM17876.1 VOC family protein [Flavobacterium sp. PMR2A8]WNM21929.1 VOC family protein [Flavobacterium sp. PMTSA4]
MATVNTYLTFNGNCEAAFNFYKSVFGGEFDFIGKFKDMPADPNFEISDEDKEKVMHVSLPISKETYLYGSDAGGEWAPTFKQGNNFSISINAQNKDEADTLFNKLSANGTVTMPMEDTFWGAYFGMFTDQFGINWMVNYDDPSKAMH